MKPLVTLFVAFAAVLSAAAQGGFTYQAAVREDDGSVMANQAVTVEFDVRQGSPAGASQYSETHNTTTTEFGIVNLVIGDGTSMDNFDAIDWSNGPFFLNVQIDGTDMGTTQFLSVPYAKYAESAGNQIWTDDANGVYVTDERVGINAEPGTRGEILTVGAESIDGGSVFGANQELVDLQIDTLRNGGDVINIGVNGELGEGQIIEVRDPSNNEVYVVESGGQTFIDSTTSNPAPKTVYGNSMPLAYGYIGTLGNIFNGYGISGATRTTTGEFTITLTNNYEDEPVVLVTCFNSTPNDEVATYEFSGPNEVIVNISNGSGSAINSAFSFVVFGTPQ